jgi:hypothetical protein
MTGILLITIEGTVAEGGAAADAEDGGATTGHWADHEAEGGAEQGTEAAHDDRAERTGPAEESPANDADHTVVAECASLVTRTSPKATATNAEDAVRAPVEEVNEAARGPIGVTPTMWRMQPSLKPRSLSSALWHVKLTPRMRALPRLAPLRLLLLRLRSRTRIP